MTTKFKQLSELVGHTEDEIKEAIMCATTEFIMKNRPELLDNLDDDDVLEVEIYKDKVVVNFYNDNSTMILLTDLDILF